MRPIPGKLYTFEEMCVLLDDEEGSQCRIGVTTK